MAEAALLKIDINELPILDASFRAIPTYRIVFERIRRIEGDHDGRKKKQNIKEAAFIHLYTCFQIKAGQPNPYWKYSEEQRYDKLVDDLDMPEGWKIDEDLQAAINLYKERVAVTFNMEMIDGAMDAGRETIKYFKGVDYNKTDVKGNLMYDPLKVMRTIREVGITLDELDKVRERLQNEQKASTSKVRGGGDVGSREVPRR